jgi:rsbT co-antagonist protein RsbR
MAQVLESTQENPKNGIKITDEDIVARKKYVDLKADDLKRVALLKETVTRNADSFVDGFFDFLRDFPEAKGLFESPKILTEARRLKKDHLVNLTQGEYGRPYVEERIKLGQLYSRAGLDTNLFLGALHYLMRNIGDHVMLKLPGEPHETFRHFMSLKKVVFFDISIIVDVLIHEREHIIRRQQQAIRELSTPVLQIRDRLLMLPIVGMIDTYRAKLLTENLLLAIRSNRAKVVVIDITGVSAVDSKVANHLVQTVAASKLMGARVIVTGLSAEIAQTLVTLGIDLGRLNTVGDLQGGIEEAERWLGYRVMKEPERAGALSSMHPMEV